MLAEEVGGIVAQRGDRIIDEGESAFGIQLVDDVGKGMHEILVALLRTLMPPAKRLFRAMRARK